MCGFCFSNRHISDFDVFKETYLDSNIVKRGGDGNNFLQKQNYFFAHSLFSVTGNEPYKQPIYDDVHYLLFNGEIYNYKELTLEYGYKDLSDTELLFSLIKKIGLKPALEQAFGAYAICYVNFKKDLITLTRDQWGQKPLYYSTEGGITVSSSFQLIEDILGKSRKKENLNTFKLFGFSPFGDSINHKIKYVLPGEIVNINIKDRYTKNIPFSLKDFSNFVNTDPINILKDSFSKTGQEKKTCIAFSGGTDSSILASINKELGSDLELMHLKIEENINEYNKSISLSNKLGSNLRVIEYDKTDNTMSSIIDHPVDNFGMTATSNLAKYASSEGYRIILTGFGSDEIFGGYSRANYFYKLKNINLNDSYHKILKAVFDITKSGAFILSIIGIFLKNKFQLICLIFLLLRNNDSREYILRNIYSSLRTLQSIDFDDNTVSNSDNFLEALSRFERLYVMPEVMCLPLDTVGQQHGIEFRSPFLHPDLDKVFTNNIISIYRPYKIILKDFLKLKNLYEPSPKERFASKLSQRSRKERIDELISN